MLFKICSKTFCLFLSLKMLFYGLAYVSKGRKQTSSVSKSAKAKCQKKSPILQPPFIFIIPLTCVHQCCKK